MQVIIKCQVLFAAHRFPAVQKESNCWQSLSETLDEMRSLVIVFVVLLAVAALSVVDSRKSDGQMERRPRVPVSCPDSSPDVVCSGPKFAGLSYFDGCNRCRCTFGNSVCTSMECPTIANLPNELKKRAKRICKKVLRVLRRKKRKRRNRVDISRTHNGCFNVTKLCRKRPSIQFFDGCNQCQCAPSGQSRQAICSRKHCPNQFPFRGTRKQLKTHCRSLGAKIKRQ